MLNTNSPGIYSEYNPDSGTISSPGMDGGGIDNSAASSGGGDGGYGTGMAIGGALGILSAIGQAHSYDAKAKEAATTTRFSPWTHMHMENPQNRELATIIGMGTQGGAAQQGLSGGSMLPMAMMAAG